MPCLLKCSLVRERLSLHMCIALFLCVCLFGEHVAVEMSRAHSCSPAHHSYKTVSSRKPLRASDEKYIHDDESTSEHSLTSSLTKRETLALKVNESDSTSNSNVPISDDSTGQAAGRAPSPTSHRKTVAIDMSQNECFTHRLLPAVSPEFDNVMDQVLYMYMYIT